MTMPTDDNDDPLGIPVPPEEPSKTEELDPRLPDRALKRMKALIEGNGVADLSTIDIASAANVKTYRFPAQVRIRLVPRSGTRTEAGKNTAAELVSGPEEMQQKIAALIQEAKTQPAKRQEIIQHVFSKPAKGFGLKEHSLTFRSLGRDLVQHEPCAACGQAGKTKCPKCQGRGMVTCPACRGSRRARCRSCGGSGRIQSGSSQKMCDTCRGDGKAPCAQCGAKGQIRCKGCAATGLLSCARCAGSGFLSHLTHIDIEGQIRFDFPRAGLPPRLVTLIESHGAVLAQRGDIEAMPREPLAADPLAAQQNPPASDDHSIVLTYDTTCPFGPITFSISEKSIPATMLGWQARLIHTPPFLEEYTRPAIKALGQAAATPAQAGRLLQEAASYALWHDLIGLVLTESSLQDAVRALFTRYPAGISEKTARQAALDIRQAVRNVTRAARLMGLAGGLLAYALFSGWYFFSGGRAIAASLLAAPAPALSHGLIALDLCLPALGGIMTGAIAAFAAHLRQQKAFSAFVPASVLKKGRWQAGRVFWGALGGAYAITAACLAILAALGSPAFPEWLAPLLFRQG